MIKSNDFRAIYDEADKAGREEVEQLYIQPMIVNEHSNMLDDASPIKQSYYVADGVCGFAWVTVKPANSGFAKFLRNVMGCHLAYGGGMQLWIGQYNQSYQKKIAYADKFATILRDHGINAYADGRLD